MKKQWFLFLMTVLNCSLLAHAQQAASSLSMNANSPKKESAFHITLGLSQGANLYSSDSPDRKAETEFLLNPSYNFTPDTSLSLKQLVFHEEDASDSTILSNTTLRLKTAGPNLGPVSSSVFIAGVAPTNEEDRKTYKIQGGAATGAGLKHQWKRLETNYVLTVLRNFHEYTVSAEGEPNIEYTLSQDLSFEFELHRLWSLSLDGTYKQAWTYENYKRDAFGVELGLNFNMNKNLQFGVAVSNEGNALKPNGVDSNIKLYDENSSSIKASVTFIN